MISLAEKSSAINVKDLAFGDPKLAKRLRPHVDFTNGVWFARSAMEGVPFLPAEFKASADKLDHQSRLFASLSNYENMKKTGTREDYLTGNFLQKSVGVKMLLIETVEDLREENRDINPNEAEKIKEALLSFAKSADDEGNREVFDHLSVVAKYPDALVWIAEALAFQESTLSLPDYYSSAEFQASDTPEVPVVRKF